MKNSDNNNNNNNYVNIDLNCLVLHEHAFMNGPFYFFRIHVSNRDDVNAIITQVQANLPNGLTNVPYRLRRLNPTTGDYLINMNQDSRIYDHFSANPDQNVIHVLVEPLPENN
ncbi:15163_t:CDS:2 [Entrophospora sp. SA101]|nr:15163_t:CDS:2 [Entrophospora sp. SA101]